MRKSERKRRVDERRNIYFWNDRPTRHITLLLTTQDTEKPETKKIKVAQFSPTDKRSYVQMTTRASWTTTTAFVVVTILDSTYIKRFNYFIVKDLDAIWNTTNDDSSSSSGQRRRRRWWSANGDSQDDDADDDVRNGSKLILQSSTTMGAIATSIFLQQDQEQKLIMMTIVTRL